MNWPLVEGLAAALILCVGGPVFFAWLCIFLAGVAHRIDCKFADADAEARIKKRREAERDLQTELDRIGRSGE